MGALGGKVATEDAAGLGLAEPAADACAACLGDTDDNGAYGRDALKKSVDGGILHMENPRLPLPRQRGVADKVYARLSEVTCAVA